MRFIIEIEPKEIANLVLTLSVEDGQAENKEAVEDELLEDTLRFADIFERLHPEKKQIILQVLRMLNGVDEEAENGYIELLAEIDKQKRLNHLKNRDLADMTGFSKSAIDGFMTGNRWSEAIAEKLREALKIPSELAS